MDAGLPYHQPQPQLSPFLHPSSPYSRQPQPSYSPAMPPPPKNRASSIRRKPGFVRVRDSSDLRPHLNHYPKGRRADPSHTSPAEPSKAFISPLKALSVHIASTYRLVNPDFQYEQANNPRRVLTKPSKPAGNNNHDNEDSDYILYVNNCLGSDDSQKYLILELLGQGTFGQVVKCQNLKTHEICAVKVVKNKPAYFNQSMMEVSILDQLNKTWDPTDEHHILRLKDTFIHCNHLCLVFELLDINLYELIKQSNYAGLESSLVRVFTNQLLDCLQVLQQARIIHCDLKPENILLETLNSVKIKVIDFGSACHERQTVYTYIQSRFYRSPEVLLGLPYNSSIDMWSLGCICVELFLGLPLFPGTSEYNQLSRIVDMLGHPPAYMLETGAQASNFFEFYTDQYGVRQARLKSMEKYSEERGVREQPSKQYFNAKTLPDIIMSYKKDRKSSKPGHYEKEMASRVAFIDFVSGLLNLDPMKRWTPVQARMHPFVLNEPLTKPFVPPPATSKSNRTGGSGGGGNSNGNSGSGSGSGGNTTPSKQPHTPISHQVQSSPQTTSSSSYFPQPIQPAQSQQQHKSQLQNPSQQQQQQQQQQATSDYKIYGGLPPAPQRSNRTYDAASYSKHLAQQQAYTAQSNAQAYRQSQYPTNPYAEDIPMSSTANSNPNTTTNNNNIASAAASLAQMSSQHHQHAPPPLQLDIATAINQQQSQQQQQQLAQTQTSPNARYNPIVGAAFPQSVLPHHHQNSRSSQPSLLNIASDARQLQQPQQQSSSSILSMSQSAAASQQPQPLSVQISQPSQYHLQQSPHQQQAQQSLQQHQSHLHHQTHHHQQPSQSHHHQQQQQQQHSPQVQPYGHHDHIPLPLRKLGFDLQSFVPPDSNELGKHSLTPILHRADQQEAWERLHATGFSSSDPTSATMVTTPSGTGNNGGGATVSGNGNMQRRQSQAYHPRLSFLTEQADTWGLPLPVGSATSGATTHSPRKATSQQITTGLESPYGGYFTPSTSSTGSQQQQPPPPPSLQQLQQPFSFVVDKPQANSLLSSSTSQQQPLHVQTQIPQPPPPAHSSPTTQAHPQMYHPHMRQQQQQQYQQPPPTHAHAQSHSNSHSHHQLSQQSQQQYQPQPQQQLHRHPQAGGNTSNNSNSSTNNGLMSTPTSSSSSRPYDEVISPADLNSPTLMQTPAAQQIPQSYYSHQTY